MLTARDARNNHTTTGLALWSSLTLETRSHPWVPAGHPQYTGAHHDGKAVDGPITTTTMKSTAHFNILGGFGHQILTSVMVKPGLNVKRFGA